MDRFVEQSLAPTLGGFAMTRVLCDIRNHASIEDHLPIALGIKAAIEVEIRAFQYEARLFCDVLQCFQTIWKQHHIRFIDRSHWAWRQHIAMIVRHGNDFLTLLMFVPRIPNPIAPFLATVLVPSPCSTLTSSGFSAARCLTLAINACQSDPSSAHLAKTL